jgi:hypothetical protein
MAVHPLTYAYLASRYTLTPTLTVRCRRAWYQARVHPSASGPSEPRRRWLEKAFPKCSKAEGVRSDHHPIGLAPPFRSTVAPPATSRGRHCSWATLGVSS